MPLNFCGRGAKVPGMVGGRQNQEASRPAFGGRQSITFYCGPSVSPWDPDSLFDGIGGSEEAVILLSRQFAELGWDTFVFGAPRGGRAQNFAGVWWIPHEEFDSRNQSQVFI